MPTPLFAAASSTAPATYHLEEVYRMPQPMHAFSTAPNGKKIETLEHATFQEMPLYN